MMRIFILLMFAATMIIVGPVSRIQLALTFCLGFLLWMEYGKAVRQKLRPIRIPLIMRKK